MTNENKKSVWQIFYKENIDDSICLTLNDCKDKQEAVTTYLNLIRCAENIRIYDVRIYKHGENYTNVLLEFLNEKE